MFDLSTITHESVIRPPRMILLGVEKIGKSTFAASSDRPIIVQVKGEEGIDDLTVAKTPQPVNTFDECLGWFSALHSQEHNHGTVVLDSTSAFEALVWKATCEKYNVKTIEEVLGGYGKGYTETLAFWTRVTEWLDALRRDRGMASILIGHVKIKRVDDPIAGSYDAFLWDLHEKAANLLFRWADLILFCNSKVIVRTEDVGFNKEKKRGTDLMGGRYLYTQKKPSHPGGGRGIYGRIPYELPLDWDAFVAAVAAAGAQA
jgi:hypothetical protein